jgi:hypothetical protein
LSRLVKYINAIWKTANRYSSAGIVTGYDVANKLRLITKEPNRDLLGNQRATHEAVHALITKFSLVKFSIITIEQNFTLLPTCVLYEMPLLPGISNRSCNTEKLSTTQLWTRRYLKVFFFYLTLTADW